MSHPIVRSAKRVFRSSNLLFLNGLLCMAYPLCYAFLVLLPFGENVYDPQSAGTGVLVINLLFLIILALNLNTIIVTYRQLEGRQSLLTRVIFVITFSIWLLYVLVSCCFTIMIPGFITKFYHFVNHDFRMIDWKFFILLSAFGFGMTYMSWLYYSRKNMKWFGAFLSFALLLFSYKLMLPYFLFMAAWIFFAGFNFCLYFEIADKIRFSKQLHLNIFPDPNSTIGLINFEKDFLNPM